MASGSVRAIILLRQQGHWGSRSARAGDGLGQGEDKGREAVGAYGNITVQTAGLGKREGQSSGRVRAMEVLGSMSDRAAEGIGRARP